MIFGFFTLLVALTISAVAAYYSIAGLTAIFAAAVTPIIIMGAALELGKITATVWLHKYWRQCALQFKLYLIPAILVLMIITSMGIFGFLSKAHMDQTVTVGDSASKVSILDEKIATERTNIDSAKRALQQMDAQVDQLLGRTTDDRGANRAVQVRKQQAKERKSLQAEITQAQKNIAELQAERAPLAAETRKIEAEVGPVKYIAALIYGDNPDANLLERAVRWVIILLVLVFDPLALVLILAAEQTLEWSREDKRKRKDWHQEWVPNSENPWHDEPAYEPDDGPLTDAQIDEINRLANVRVRNVTTTSSLFDDGEEFFERGKELAREIDANQGKFPTKDFSPDEYLDSIEDAPANAEDSELKKKLEELTKELENKTATAKQLQDTLTQTELDLASAILVIQEKEAPPPADPVPDFAITEADADNVEPTTTPTHAGFGTKFPPNPERGDMFLRVDQLPNRLYKWNGQKWIEVEKTITDRYAYEEEYINYITEKVKNGEYDFHELTKPEQEEVLKKLDYTAKSRLK